MPNYLLMALAIVVLFSCSAEEVATDAGNGSGITENQRLQVVVKHRHDFTKPENDTLLSEAVVDLYNDPSDRADSINAINTGTTGTDGAVLFNYLQDGPYFITVTHPRFNGQQLRDIEITTSFAEETFVLAF